MRIQILWRQHQLVFMFVSMMYVCPYRRGNYCLFKKIWWPVEDIAMCIGRHSNDFESDDTKTRRNVRNIGEECISTIPRSSVGNLLHTIPTDRRNILFSGRSLINNHFWFYVRLKKQICMTSRWIMLIFLLNLLVIEWWMFSQIHRWFSVLLF